MSTKHTQSCVKHDFFFLLRLLSCCPAVKNANLRPTQNLDSWTRHIITDILVKVQWDLQDSLKLLNYFFLNHSWEVLCTWILALRSSEFNYVEFLELPLIHGRKSRREIDCKIFTSVYGLMKDPAARSETNIAFVMSFLTVFLQNKTCFLMTRNCHQ